MKSIKREPLAKSLTSYKNLTGLTYTEIAKRGGLDANSLSSVIHHGKFVTLPKARKIGKGLGFSDKRINTWIHALKSGDESGYIPKKHFIPRTISQTVFAKSVNTIMADNGITSNQACARGHFSRGNFDRIRSLNAKNKPKTITAHTIERVAPGLGMDKAQMHDWVKSMQKQMSTDYKKNNKAVVFYPPKKKASANSNLANVLKSIMADNNISLDKAVKKSGLNKDRLQAVLDGKQTTMPTLSIQRFAKGLGVSAEPILNINDKVIERKNKARQKAQENIQFKKAQEARDAIAQQNEQPSQEPESADVSASQSNSAKKITNSDAMRANSNLNSAKSKTPNIPEFNDDGTKQTLYKALLGHGLKTSDNINNMSNDSDKSNAVEHEVLTNNDDDYNKFIAYMKEQKENKANPQKENDPVVRHAVNDLKKLNDADVSIIDLFIQRLLNSNYRN